MSTFFPTNPIDQKPLPPSRAERFSSWVFGFALVPVMSLQMIGAVPLHAARDSGLGMLGGAVDSICDRFHGLLSSSVPHSASWTAALPGAVTQGVYFGALALTISALALSVALGWRREQINFHRRMGDAKCW